MHERERLKQEYDSLPQWTRSLLDALGNVTGYGCRVDEDDPKELSIFVTVGGFASHATSDALFDAVRIASCLTAPMPGSYNLNEIRIRRSAVNLVEMVAESDDCGFDQPCAFGHRVEGHAVYCHNDAWSGGPRKCRRTWYTGGEERDEDCPGFCPNPNAQQ